MDLNSLLEAKTKYQEMKKEYERQFLIKFGESIMQRRKDIGLTQEELGSLVGLTRTSIVNIEKGNQDTTISTLMYLCPALRCSLKDLMPNV